MTDLEKALNECYKELNSKGYVPPTPIFISPQEYWEWKKELSKHPLEYKGGENSYYTDDANKVEYDMDKAIEKMTIKVQEDQENFIFEIVSSFIEEKTELRINKQLLVDALTEFREKHPERFEEVEG